MKTPFLSSSIITSAALLIFSLAFSSCPSFSRTHHVSGDGFSDGTYRFSDGTFGVDEKIPNSVMMLFGDPLRFNDQLFPSHIRRVEFRRPRTAREVMYICHRLGLAFAGNDPDSWQFVC